MAKVRSRAHTSATFARSDHHTSSGGEIWEQTGLVARVEFSGTNMAAAERRTKKAPATPSRFIGSASLSTPSLVRNSSQTLPEATSATPNSLRILKSTGSFHAQPLFRVQRKDEATLEGGRQNGLIVEGKDKTSMLRSEHQPLQMDTSKKSRIELNVDDESFKLHLQLSLRHIFTFPFLAMIGMASKGIEMGVGEAEENRATRISQTKMDNGADKKGATTVGLREDSATIAQQPKERTRGLSPSYRIPKRPRPFEEDDTANPPAKRMMTDSPRISSVPRRLSSPRFVTPSPSSRSHWSNTSSNGSHFRYDSPRSVSRYHDRGTPATREDLYARREPAHLRRSSAHRDEHFQAGGSTGGYTNVHRRRDEGYWR